MSSRGQIFPEKKSPSKVFAQGERIVLERPRGGRYSEKKRNSLVSWERREETISLKGWATGEKGMCVKNEDI